MSTTFDALPAISQQQHQPREDTRRTFSYNKASGNNTTRSDRVTTILSSPLFEDHSSRMAAAPSLSISRNSSVMVQTPSSISKYTTEFSVYRPPYIPQLCRSETTTAAERYHAKKKEQQERYETALVERQVTQSGASALAPGTAALLRRRATGATSGNSSVSLPPIQQPTPATKPSCLVESELADEMEMEILKNKLSRLDKTRGLKEYALSLTNAPRMERDKLREEYFRSAFKTPEQLEAERQEDLRRALERDIEKLVLEELSAREDEIEEESLEYQYQLYTLHLQMVSISVHAVIQERARVNFQVKLVEEERSRKLASTQQMLHNCEYEAEFGTERRKGTEREEGVARRVLANLFETCLANMHAEETRRNQEFTNRQEEEERQRLNGIRLAQEAEEDDAERALLEKMAAIDRKYAALAQPSKIM